MIDINVIAEPKVTLLGEQVFYNPLADEGWDTDAPSAGEALTEFAGRLCYLSFFEGEMDGHRTIKGRQGNDNYLNNILSVGHGSVTEHAVWSVLIEGVSRSLTHELVRHRAGMAYSQLSQRYVDESNVAFVLPPEVKPNTSAYRVWAMGCKFSLDVYRDLLEEVKRGLEGSDEKATTLKKKARQTARSLLPNCAETKIVVTGNARAWRHFLGMRGAPDADTEIRVLAVKLAELLKDRAPNMFNDCQISQHTDGKGVVTVGHWKV